MTSPLIRRFTRNTVGRDFLCGDIHGHVKKLSLAMAAVDYDGSKDRLFLLGDLVDRGPESDLVLNLLDVPGVYALRGNHDQWAIDFHEGRADVRLYARNGGAWFIGKTPAERQPFVDAFSALPLAIELETEHGLLALVHADSGALRWAPIAEWLRDPTIPPDILAGLQNVFLWDRSRVDQLDATEVKDVLAVCVGHTPVERITSLGNTLYLDTGAWLPRGGDFVLLDASRIRAGGAIA